MKKVIQNRNIGKGRHRLTLLHKNDLGNIVSSHSIETAWGDKNLTLDQAAYMVTAYESIGYEVEYRQEVMP